MTTNRETYTRVTDILYPFSGMDKINPEILRKAADRGRKVHEYCGGVILGFGIPDAEPEFKGYLDSFLSWWQDHFDIIAHEERFYDDELQITGQTDLIIKDKDITYLVDFKTSASPNKSWPLQLSAYRRMAKCHVDHMYVVQLKKDGSNPKIHTYSDNYELFLNCYKVYKYFYKNKETIDLELI